MSSRLTSSSRRPPSSSRPMSSVKQAGYVSGGLETSGGKFVLNPLQYAADTFAQILKDQQESPAAKLKAFKKQIYEAIYASSACIAKQDIAQALLKAKEAETQMKQMQDFIASKSLEEPDFKTLKFTVIMQLADAYKANQMWDEAKHRYMRIMKDREFPHPYIISLELGNIAFNQQKYAEAVTNYEMGINHLRPEASVYKARFHHCCGVAQIQLREFSQALSSFGTAMRLDPSIKTGFNLVLCHSLLSSIEDLRESYVRLLSVKPSTNYETNESDVLGNQMHIQRREEVRLIMLASRLVASKSNKDWQEGYEFVLSKLKASKYPEAEGEFEIAFALAYLNHRNATKAIEMLRQIRKKDPSLVALAATNLSFLYFLEQDYEKADLYATKALEHDKYNAQALVNKGNCLMLVGRDEEARDSYLEAIGVEADCVEALYNLGVVSKVMGLREEALQVFEKLNRIVPSSPEVLYEICDCYSKADMTVQEIDWIHRLINLVPSDPQIWRRLGDIWDRDQNETQAYHCYVESYKFCPSDVEVISWLGSYFRKHQNYEKALEFFERASDVMPKEVRYLMMAASCHRMMDNREKAMEVYERVLQMDPGNRTCLEHLVKVTSEMGLSSKSEHYKGLLREVMSQIREDEEEEGRSLGVRGMQGIQMVGNEFRNAPELRVGEDERPEIGRAGREEINFDDVDIDLPD